MLQHAVALDARDAAADRIISYAPPALLKINNAQFYRFRDYEHFLPEAVTLVHRFSRNGDDSSDDGGRVYRIRESLGRVNRLLGEPVQEAGDPADYTAFLVNECEKILAAVESASSPSTPLVTLVLDRNLGFRDAAPDAAVEIIKRSDVVIWKMDSPLGRGELWRKLESSGCLNKVVLVLKEECLRQLGVNIRKEGSIERTFHEFTEQLRPDKRLHVLAHCRHLVVNFGHGAILYDDEPGRLGGILNMGGARAEGAAKAVGEMAGNTTILMAAIAKSICHSYAINNPAPLHFQTIAHGARLGTFLSRKHFENGYADGDFFKKLDDSQNRHVSLPKPFSKLFQDLLPSSDGSVDEVRKHVNSYDFCEYSLLLHTDDAGAKRLNLKTWSRYEQLCPGERERSADSVAIDIVRRGVNAVTEAPDETGLLPPWLPPVTRRSPSVGYGDIQSLFREEIDRFASIEFLVSDYLRHEDRRRPLSLACFGAPGAGKGFTVKQILSRINPEMGKNSLNFNLAQFSSARDLAVALHQVQDRVLSSETPLVVFDEFDTTLDAQPWGWLKYFLAPMQDGNFKEGDSTYRIGRAIFLFVGGISRTFKDFAVKNHKNVQFEAAKGPDFVSRLRGHLDIAGIDHAARRDRTAVKLRRAIILRQLTEQHLNFIIDPATKIARIESEVIRAFLGISKFAHGVRSMEAIVEMSHVSSSRKSFTRSSIPATAQLSMHVNADKFEEIMGA